MSKQRSRRRRMALEELSGVELGDPRRERRALGIMKRLASSPEASLPDAMLDRATLEALYRHLSSPEVSFEKLIEPHVAKAAARVAAAGEAYAVHDTTEFTFPGDAEREGLGTVNELDQGFVAHVTVAVSSDGTRTPLGLLATELIVRKAKVGAVKKKKRPGRESLRWGRGVAAAEKRAPEAQLIHVADREGDIYELLASMKAEGHRFIVRAAQDRRVEVEGEGLKRLFNAVRETAPTFAIEVPVSRRKRTRGTDSHVPRDARIATLSFAALPLRLKRPEIRDGEQPASLEVNVVHVFEVGPPVGEKPIEWLLLTSEPIAERRDVERIVEGYRTRWTIEEYFKAVKSGCACESRQLESFHTLTNLLAFTLVVAYALLLMRALSRTGAKMTADAVLEPHELAVLRKKKKLAPDASVRDALLAIAALGGHLKNNGDPGWRVLSRGWRRLRDYAEGYRLARGQM